MFMRKRNGANLSHSQFVKNFFLSPYGVSDENKEEQEKNIHLENQTGPHCLK